MIEALGQLYYIIDGSGNFYRLSENDQLVQAMNKENAGVFSFSEANSRIGSGKKSYFYSTIPVEQDDTQAEPEMESKGDEYHNINWLSYLQDFVFLASHISVYRKELMQRLSTTDQKICDILHYIELYEINENKALDMMDMLRRYREERRDIKDEMVKLELFEKSIGNSANIFKVKDSIKQIKRLETRKYTPRQLPEIFRDSVMRGRSEEGQWQEKCGREEKTDAYQEELVMERHQTVFDGKSNNWIAFARQQVQFYENVKQYMINLQMDIQDIGSRLEEILNTVEMSNANAAQGYRLFKTIKDLRVQKKGMQEELLQLQQLTGYVDCGYLRDTYQYNLEQMEKEAGTERAEIVELGRGNLASGE